MGRSVSKSTLGTWLTKKAWLSLAAVVVGLLAASIGMSLLGSSVVSAQSNSAPTVSISSPSSPVYLVTDASRTFRASASDADDNLSKWQWWARRDRFLLPDFVYTPGEQTFDTTPSGSVSKDFSYTFGTEGDWTVEVKFTDSEGESGSVSWDVDVADPVTVQFSPSSYRVNESDGEVDITMTLSESLSSAAEMQLSGYRREVKTVTIPANSTSHTTSLTVTAYPGVGPTETTYTLRLGTSDVRLSVNTATATLTVVDDTEATVDFQRNIYRVEEGTRDLTVVLEVTNPQVRCPVWVTFNVYFSYSDPDGVFASVPTSPVQFRACHVRQAIRFGLNNDSVVEETSNATLSLDRVTSDSPGVASRVQFGPSSPATVEVFDSRDRAFVEFEHARYSVTEGEAAEMCAVLREGDSVAFPFTVNLSYTDSDGSGPTSLTFGALDTKSCAEFRPRDDDVLSYTRTLSFRLERPSDLDRRIVVSTRGATVEVFDDPSDRAYVEFEHASYSVTEGEAVEVCAVLRPGDSVAFPFTVNLSYTDPDGVVSSAPSSLRFGTLDTKSCAEFQTSDDDVGTGNSEVSFSLAGPSDIDRRIMVSRTTATLTVINDDSTNTVNVTVASSPSGRTVTVDGTNRTAPYTATWNSGSSHTLNAPSPQNILGVNSRYAFSRWSHGGSRSQTVSPTSNSNYTANFTLQHFLSTRSSPTGPGVAGGGQWYNHNSTAFVGPAPTVAGYNFSFWRKDGQSIGTDPAGVSVTVDGPILVEAVFTPVGENRPPTIADDDLSPSTESVILFAGATQTFEARATDLDNNISSVVWYVDDVVVWDPGSVASIPLTGDFPSSYDHTFSYPDTFIVKVTFTDAEGATASHSWTVQADPATEESAPSVVRIAPEAEEISLYTTQTQDFTVEATDIDGDIVSWKWDIARPGSFDHHEEPEEIDSTGNITKEFSYKFRWDGNYTVTVTFTDSEGRSDFVEWEVEVTDGPDLEVEGLTTIGGKPPYPGHQSFSVDIWLSNHRGTAVDEYEILLYLKNTGVRFHKAKELEEREFVPDVDILLASRQYEDGISAGEKEKTLRVDTQVQNDIKAGPYWLCALIAHKETSDDVIPDLDPNDNFDCTVTYVVSSRKIADLFYPIDPTDGEVGRFWLGVSTDLWNPHKVRENIIDNFRSPSGPAGYFHDSNRVELYRTIALELATRKTLIETEGYLAILELAEHVDPKLRGAALFRAILDLYKAVHNVEGGASGLVSHVAFVLDTFDFLVTGFDLYMAILINRAVNIDNSYAVLEFLIDLPIDKESDDGVSEWKQGVMLAMSDVEALADTSAWKQAIRAANDLALKLIASAVKFVLALLGKAGVVIKGIALGSSSVGTVIFAIFANVALFIAVQEKWDNYYLSLLAGQVYVELYDEEALGDHLEVQTYAKYLAFDRAYQSEDSWWSDVGNFLAGNLNALNRFRRKAATLRDAALEEARAVVRVAEIKFDPSHYFLKVGEELKLEPEFMSVSGKKMIGFGVEWRNYAGVNEAIDLDVNSQTVTGRAAGDARIVASIGDVHGSVTFTVIDDSICSGGAVSDGTNLGLLDDCEALLVARDTLAGTATLNWSETTPITQWDGVSLGGTPQRVTRLNLAGKGLSGTIPPVLGRLSMLTHLNLRSNDGLTGGIPSELGYLSNLRVLNLHSNSHSGSIPDLSGMSSLEELYLPNNADYNADGSKVQGTGLTGGIPAWLNGMTNMRELWFWGNSLTGSIPDLSGMSSLQKLKLANNNLTGGVPAASMLPPNMTWLIIDRNPLGGTIPDLSSLTRLKLLWLHSSDLTGNIPAGNNFSASLDDLNLRDNSLTGTIPDLSNLDNLTRLRLHNNSLSGEVPGTLGGLDSLKYLWLHNEVDKGLGNNSFTSIASGVGGLGDTLIQIALNGNPWADGACVPSALANVAKNDYAEAGIEVCSADDGS